MPFVGMRFVARFSSREHTQPFSCLWAAVLPYFFAGPCALQDTSIMPLNAFERH